MAASSNPSGGALFNSGRSRVDADKVVTFDAFAVPAALPFLGGDSRHMAEKITNCELVRKPPPIKSAATAFFEALAAKHYP